MKDRIAVSLRVAAFSLFDKGFSFNQVNEILNGMKQPSPGYVYADEIPNEVPE